MGLFQRTKPGAGPDLPFRPRRRELNPTQLSGGRAIAPFLTDPDLPGPLELRRALAASLPRDRLPTFISTYLPGLPIPISLSAPA
jgi:hypothetical protein